MNIAILMLNAGRGSGEVARAHARGLVAAGHSVHFVQPGIGDGVEGVVSHEVVLPSDIMPVHEYLPSAANSQKAVSMMNRAEAEAYLPAYVNSLEGVIEGIDLLIGHHANLTAIATAQVAKRHGKPYALLLHGTGIEPRHHGGYDDTIWSAIEASIQQANGIIVTTDYVRDVLVRPLVDVPMERFLVLPCGVDSREFHPDHTGDVVERYDLPPGFVICPGALTAAKGPQNVLAAMAHYADLAHTVFIGDGELRREIEGGLNGRGRCLGFVPAADKAMLINAASVLVGAPEKQEHFGIIYVEGMAGGTVPVAYTGGGVPSIITPQVGVLCERTPDDLGRVVRSLLLDDERRLEMAVAGRRRAEQEYDYPTLVGRLVDWLGTL